MVFYNPENKSFSIPRICGCIPYVNTVLSYLKVINECFSIFSKSEGPFTLPLPVLMARPLKMDIFCSFPKQFCGFTNNWNIYSIVYCWDQRHYVELYYFVLSLKNWSQQFGNLFNLEHILGKITQPILTWPDQEYKFCILSLILLLSKLSRYKEFASRPSIFWSF